MGGIKAACISRQTAKYQKHMCYMYVGRKVQGAPWGLGENKGRVKNKKKEEPVGCFLRGIAFFWPIL
jgi:hypothetical protein